MADTEPRTLDMAVTAAPVPGFTAAEQAVLDDIVRRIVAVAAPERIMLFGSAARGDARPDSDLDPLVVKRSPGHRGALTDDISMRLVGAKRSVDLVVVTLEDVERDRPTHALVIAPALRDGRVVYDAA